MEADSTRLVRACSPFFDRLAERHPRWLAQLGEADRLLGDRPPSAGLLTEELQQHPLDTALRRFRNREMMRIVWRELAQAASLEQTLHDLSRLAEVCLQAAHDTHLAQLQERYGTPRSADGRAQRLVVLGLGKLGGRELNLSSDIDLILCYPSAGECDGRRGLANEQFFTRLARAMIRSLAEITADGFCFRVDTRLRPFGDAGPLVASFGALEQYYQREGRDWERYALIKARPVAGDADAGGDLLDSLKPFVYRRYIDYGAVEALQEMLDSIRQDAARRDRGQDIKRGPGGIREIEFLVQCMQLLRGGREPGLQTTSLLAALAELERLELFPAERCAALRADYTFLRRLENAIQALHDQQTHSLPAGDDLLRVARAMRFQRPTELLTQLDATRRRVETSLEQSFPRPAEPERPPDDWQAMLDAEPGLWGPAMQDFRARLARIPLSPKAHERLHAFMPMLIERLQAQARNKGAPSQAGVQADALELVLAICRRSAYLSLLVQNPAALDRMLKLFQRSDWIAQTVIRYPALLDELIDPALGHDIPDRQTLQASLERLLLRHSDPELQLETLNYTKAAQSLRIAVAELDQDSAGVAADRLLTELAEVLITQCLHMAGKLVEQRHGRMPPPGLAVIAYGTLGGQGMNYASDLDLVFLYGNEEGESDGERPLGPEPYFTRLTRRLLALCTTLTSAGRLYAIDTRLRPNGRAGLLVSSLRAFSHYQGHSAWVWEWQALVRARAIAGDSEVCAHFEQLRREVLGQAREAQTLRAEVRAMRQRIRQELDGGDPFKHAPGGLLDIDFIAQLGVLECAHCCPPLCAATDTVEQLRLLGDIDWLPAGEAETLIETHQALSLSRRWLFLCRDKTTDPPDTEASRKICARYLA